jgi:citrate lyase subunit beta / citryl-CoA lyase
LTGSRVGVPIHPRDALFIGEPVPPALPVCEHIAGSEKLIRKSFELQSQLGKIFDLTCDCEDGAKPGQELEHASMVGHLIASGDNVHAMAGARIHDATHPMWRDEIEILLKIAGWRIAYVTLPKVVSAAQASETILYIQNAARRLGIDRVIPIHVLIETHGAVRDVHNIATLPWLQVLDFGLMDLVSAHHGAIPAEALRSPGQFENRLLARAQTEMTAAALAHGIVPSHGVTLDIRNPRAAYEDALRARREFGFLRKWSIHPSQIEPIVTAMRPEHTQVEFAGDLLLAAQAAGWGPIQFQGEMHDKASYRLYWDILQKAVVTGLELNAAVNAAFFADSSKPPAASA